MSNPEMDPFAGHELFICPLCSDEMILLLLPVRNYGTNAEHVITERDEIEAIRQMEEPPEDIEWLEFLYSAGCGLAMDPDEYGDALDIY